MRDGELPEPKLPLILGHQIVGSVVEGDAALALAHASACPDPGRRSLPTRATELALERLRAGTIRGAAVLVVGPDR